MADPLRECQQGACEFRSLLPSLAPRPLGHPENLLPLLSKSSAFFSFGFPRFCSYFLRPQSGGEHPDFTWGSRCPYGAPAASTALGSPGPAAGTIRTGPALPFSPAHAPPPPPPAPHTQPHAAARASVAAPRAGLRAPCLPWPLPGAQPASLAPSTAPSPEGPPVAAAPNRPPCRPPDLRCRVSPCGSVSASPPPVCPLPCPQLLEQCRRVSQGLGWLW